MSVPTGYLSQFSEPAGYLDFASIGTISHRAAAALTELASLLESPSGRMGDVVPKLMEEAKQAASRLMSCRVDQVGLVSSTGVGLFHVAFGLRGGNVVVPAAEFPANLYPWWQARDAGLIDEVRLIYADEGRITPEMVASSVDAKTRAVAVSQVDYLTGFRIDPWAFREASGDALLVIDAIQAAGAVGVGLAPADVVVTGAHKWLRGGLGIAVMAVSDRALERLEPTLSGWTAVTDFLDFNLPQPREFLSGAARFLMSAPPLGAVPGMVAALDVLESAGIETIEEAVLERAMLAETVLRSAGAEVMAPWRHHGEHAGIVSFRMPNQTAGASFEALKAGGYLVALRGPWLRVSTHATSDPAQIEGLKQALS